MAIFFFEFYFAEEQVIFQLILAQSISNQLDRWPKEFAILHTPGHQQTS